MTRTRVAIAALGALALSFTLAACGVGGGGSGGSDGGPTPAPETPLADPGPQDTGCLAGTWTADVDDLAQQLATNLAGNGIDVASASGVGTQQLAFDQEGYMGISVDMTLTIVVDLSDGIVMQIVQHHTGATGADWAWDGSGEEAAGDLLFSNFSGSDYHVDSAFSINGVSTEQSIPIDLSVLTDVPMHVECSGDTLLTNQSPSPFTTVWHRAG